MCTLILGIDVVRPDSIVLAANRDEDPARPSDPPVRLSEDPPVAGGRDRQLGGTWLAVRGARAAVALLNRPPGPGAPPAAARSRGLLTLEVASVPYPMPGDAIVRARQIMLEHPHAPFTLVFASLEGRWVMSHRGDGRPKVAVPSVGWHVVTHANLDDRSEPRTAWLLDRLAGVTPRRAEDALETAESLLRTHAGDAEDGTPAVCIHDGRMVTVSSSSLWLGGDAAIYRHAEGRPCEHAHRDVSDLLRAEVT